MLRGLPPPPFLFPGLFFSFRKSCFSPLVLVFFFFLFGPYILHCGLLFLIPPFFSVSVVPGSAPVFFFFVFHNIWMAGRGAGGCLVWDLSSFLLVSPFLGFSRGLSNPPPPLSRLARRRWVPCGFTRLGGGFFYDSFFPLRSSVSFPFLRSYQWRIRRPVTFVSAS